MYKVRIQPQWELTNAEGTPLPVHLVGLLSAIHASGSLAAAARRQGVSYRYAWGQLKQAAQVFGQPLLKPQRGQGARLTALGERLVWASNRIAARLGPTLDSLATELEIELEHAVCAHSAPLRMHASHGFGVEILRRCMAAADLPLELKYRSPDDALAALRAGHCDVAGLHLPVGEFAPVLLAHYQDRIQPQHDHVIHLAMRRQGLILAPGNPRGIRSLHDLERPDIRMIQRQPGSGTRLLLDAMLARYGIDYAHINTCDVEELTHAAVAAYVASGLADVGFGLEPAARRYGLDFLPQASEHYFFLCSDACFSSVRANALIALLQSNDFRVELGKLPGYDPGACGRVQRFSQAFLSAP